MVDNVDLIRSGIANGLARNFVLVIVLFAWLEKQYSSAIPTVW